MNKIIYFVLTSLCIFSASGNTLIGQVDFKKVLMTVNEGIAIQKNLETLFEQKQSILKKENAAVQKMKEEYKKQYPLLSASNASKKKQQIQKLLIELQNKSMSFQREIQEVEQTLTTPIIEKIKEVISSISIREKIDLTIEQNGILYARKIIDLTDHVIQEYNKKYPINKSEEK